MSSRTMKKNVIPGNEKNVIPGNEKNVIPGNEKNVIPGLTRDPFSFLALKEKEQMGPGFRRDDVAFS